MNYILEAYIPYECRELKDALAQGNTMTDKTEPYTFTIDSEVADEVVHKWLLRHLAFAEDTIAQGTTHTEDWIEADKDVRTFKRALYYLTGDRKYAEQP